MNSTLLLGLMIALLVILIVLVLVLTSEPKAKKEAKKKAEQAAASKPRIPSFDELRTVFKSKNSSTEELIKAYELIVKHHGTIKDKLGIRVNPHFDRYMDLIFTMTRHKSANTKMIIGFEKELISKNPKYEREIADAFNRGLSSRV